MHVWNDEKDKNNRIEWSNLTTYDIGVIYKYLGYRRVAIQTWFDMKG